MPCAAPDSDLDDAGFNEVMANLCKRRQPKRSAEEAELDADEGEGGEEQGEGVDDAEWPVWSKADRKAKIIEYGDMYLAHFGEPVFKNWMFHSISEDLWWNEGIDASYFSVRYLLKGR